MFYRKSSLFLNDWVKKSSRRPLLLRGARQVGKSTLARSIADQFETFIEINLETLTQFSGEFQKSFGKPDLLIQTIEAYFEVNVVPGKTLLFIDEIQECPEALLSLRYFYEKMPALHVIAAGSLIEFALKDLSFPVGRIEFHYVFPMSFEEFLLAQKKSTLLKSIREAYLNSPLSEILHETALDEVRLYSVLGGMPSVLKVYFESKDLKLAQNELQILISNFRSDFSKYSKKVETKLLQTTLESCARQLGNKFKFVHVTQDEQALKVRAALQLLSDAGLVYFCHHTSSNGLPLGSEVDPKKFKVYLLDIGLAQRLLGLPLAQLFLDRKKGFVNRGEVSEQWVAQSLVALTAPNDEPKLYYWHREAKNANAEVDFITVQNGVITPIEVKSGTQGRMKSLHLFLKEKQLSRAIRVSAEIESEIQSPAEAVRVRCLAFYQLESALANN